MKKPATMAALVAAALFMATPASSQDQIPLDVEVVRPPAQIKSSNGYHLVYEVSIRNHNRRTITLVGLDVLAGDEVVFSAPADALAGMVARPGKRLSGAKALALEGGSFAVIYLDLRLDQGDSYPKTLTHRLSAKAEGIEEIRVMDIFSPEITPHENNPLVIAPPLKGERWLVWGGLENDNHRRSLIALDGSARIAQRFAIDFVQLAEDGTLWSGKAGQNGNWYGYGAEILSVFDGEVVAIKDGIPENSPGAGETAVPITLETIGGNYVIVKSAEEKYAFFAHMQPGALTVKIGDKVTKGQNLGLVGNSGSSAGPHLHFHVMDFPLPLAAEGVEYVFSHFKLAEIQPVKLAEILTDPRFLESKDPVVFKSDELPSDHTNELPLNGSIVTFEK